MKEKRQNPFPYSDSNKRYYSFDYYLKHTYGGKAVKLSLDAGMTCPNIDGTCGRGGCIYCSPRGSGDFAPSPLLSLSEQYEKQREIIGKKWDNTRCIPYLQAHTNTYLPVDELRKVYAEVLCLPNMVAFHLATRADCLPCDVLALLAEVSEKIPLTVELGLQSANDKTAELICRGHDRAVFERGFLRLRERVPRARISVHLINGLPQETLSDMLESAAYVASLHADEVKLHLMHVIAGTRLADDLKAGRYTPMTLPEYVDTVVRQLELLPPDTVIGRLTGDGDKATLLAPLWSLRKTVVLNEIDKQMARENTWQGKYYK